MKKPKSVKILGRRIKIRYKTHNPDAVIAGYFTPDPMEIHILENDYWESTLFHECLHAALYISGISTTLEIKEEESIVTAVEHALFGLYKRTF